MQGHQMEINEHPLHPSVSLLTWLDFTFYKMILICQPKLVNLSLAYRQLIHFLLDQQKKHKRYSL